MSFHRTYPRARVHKLGANAGRKWAGNWGVTISGNDYPENVSFRDLSYAHIHAAILVGKLRTAAAQPAPKNATPITGLVRPCPDCGRATRPQKSDAGRYPGTITRCDKEGRCNTCWAKNKKAAKTRQPDEPATVPMTEAEAEVSAAMPAPRSPRPAPLRPVPAPVVTEQVREATATYTAPAVPIGPHYLKPDPDAEPACACGWDPYAEMSDIPDRSAAVTAVRLHLRKVRTVS